MAITATNWIDEGAQNINGNFTRCTYRADVTSTNGSYNLSPGASGSGNFDGLNFNIHVTIPKNTTKRMFDIEKDVYHGDDGTKTVTGSFNLSTGTSSGVIHREASKTLTPIPRGATLDSFTCSTKYYDGSFTIKYTPKTNNYYYRLRISVPYVEPVEFINLGGGEANVQGSKTFTLTSQGMSNMLKHVKIDSPYIQIGAVIETYSTQDFDINHKISESTEKILNMELPLSYSPKIGSVTAQAINPYNGKYIKGRSQCKITINNATGAAGSTIKEYSVTGDTLVYHGASNTVTTSKYTNSGNITYTASVTDTRGRTTKSTINVNVLDYYMPKLSVTTYRCREDKSRDDSSGTYICVNVWFDVCKVEGNDLNVKKITIDGKQVATNFTLNANTIFGTYALNAEHTVRVDIQDKLGNAASYSTTIGIGVVPFNIRNDKNGVGIGRYCSTAGECQIGYKLNAMNGLYINGVNLIDYIYPVGHQIYNSSSTFNPNKKYPGTTWVRIKGVVLGGINEGDTDTNSQTSFNNKAGHVIGSKWLQSHNHGLPGYVWNWGATTANNVYAHVNAAGGNTPENNLYTSQGVWNSTDKSGGGGAQNIQPTRLTYIWERTK